MIHIDAKRGERLLAQSAHYYIVSRYETVLLYSKEDDREITCIGDFYGDPAAALIDRRERFCVTAGCGYIVYFLREPFRPYEYHKNVSQWLEGGRGPENILWIDGIRQTDSDALELTLEDGSVLELLVSF